MKHPEKRSKNSPDQQTLQPLTVEVTKAPSNPGAVGDLSKQVSAEVPVLGNFPGSAGSASVASDVVIHVVKDCEIEPEPDVVEIESGSEGGEDTAIAKPGGCRGQAKRHRYTLSFRKDCLDHMDKLTAEGHKHPATAASEFFLVPRSNLVKWAKPKNRADLAAALRNDMRDTQRKANSKQAKKTHLHAGRKAKFHIAEQETHRLYKQHRAQGRRVSGRWLKAQMRKQVKTVYGDFVASTFKASKGWFHAFITRYGITLRKQSNSKSQSAETRKPNIQKWHACLRRRVKRGV